jgi:hypothetical protein
MRPYNWVIAATLIAFSCNAQHQVTDLDADVSVPRPAYAIGEGPVVVIDTAHANFHTASDRYGPFASLLRNDGFVVGDGTSASIADTLSGIKILVISNAYPVNDGNMFSTDEIAAIKTFVEHGGSLLLIADHAPFPLAVMDLAAAFGIRWYNVYAGDKESDIFKKGKGLMEHPITKDIEQVRTFGGSAFTIEGVPHIPILVMNSDWTLQTLEGTGLSEKSPAAGLLQGALIEFGHGRIAVFGEAAMFTAQKIGREKMGFHAKGAEDNGQFILNLMHWLSGEGFPDR